MLLLAGIVSAQSTTIVPSSAATTRPTRSPFYSAYVFYSSTSTTPASHSQTIIDCSDIAIQSGLWRSITTRRPIGLGNSNPAMTTNATLVMSLATTNSAAATTTYATNHGATPKTLINGNISLPSAANQSTWPSPWVTAFPFSAPFVYTGVTGGSLVIDMTQVQTTGASSWYVEYTSPDLGGRANNGNAQSGCKFSNGKYNNSLSYTSGGLNNNGGSWYVSYNNLLPNVVGVVALSAYGLDNKGAWPIPIDLTQAGAPGCSWHVGLEIGFLGALTASATGSARLPTIQIPAGLGGSAFYDHTLWLDAQANSAGWVTGWSSKWSIGTGIGAPSAFIYSSGTSYTATTGPLTAGACPTWQLQ
ncbi:MAG: hypothetical protein KDC95_03400 [Planctomycetes bacterium]|nr:hypothetical protein [Planctomycetota bacterium]